MAKHAKMRVPSESEPGDYLSLDRAEPRDNDILVVAELRCRGFSGRIDTWVLREAWLAFCDQLGHLEESRRGEACVESISPKELRLTFRATDAVGHMAVEGLIGYRGVHGEVLLSFSSMPFDPSLLPSLVHKAREIAG